MSRHVPRVWCDFNAGLENGAYCLETRGSRDSLCDLPGGPVVSMVVLAWTEDELDDGRPAILIAGATLEQDETGRWQARVRSKTFRHEVG